MQPQLTKANAEATAGPTLLQISIYTLIALGVVLCLGALLWTRVIKPNSFAYSHKSRRFQRLYQSWINQLEHEAPVQAYQNLMLNLGSEQAIILERMVVTVQNVYLVANPLSKHTLRINRRQNQIKILTKRRELSLPPDLNLLIAQKKRLARAANISNIYVLVPVNNPNFTAMVVQHLHFISTPTVFATIQQLEEQNTTFDARAFNALIKLKTVPQRRRRSLKFWTWDKQ